MKRVITALCTCILIFLPSCQPPVETDPGQPPAVPQRWTHPADLSDFISPDGGGLALNPYAAAGVNGGAVISWDQYIAPVSQIFMSEIRDGNWVHPAGPEDNISPDGFTASAAQIAMSANGDVVIVWQQSGGIFKSERRNGVWSHPDFFISHINPPSSAMNANNPAVAMDADGDTIIVWSQSDGTAQRIFKSERRNGVWTHPAGLADWINPAGSTAQYPKVAMDAAGNAVIVWQQVSGTYRAFKSEYRNGVWTHPAGASDCFSPPGQIVEGLRLAMSAGGDAVILWRQSDGSHLRIFKSEYRHGAWTHPAGPTDALSLAGQDAECNPRAVLDTDGDTLIVWSQSDGSNTRVFLSEYRNGVWVHPADTTDGISPAGQEGIQAQAAMGDNGDAIIVWTQVDGFDARILKSERRGGTWTHPAGLSDGFSPSGTAASQPHAAMDARGNTLVVWIQTINSKHPVFKSEYR